jgi:branched-chain amino acid aminotransferase
MVNYNGTLVSKDVSLFKAGNRAFTYGDQLFETILFREGDLKFWEDHYFRIMGGACLLRMDIPIHLNIDFIQTEILRTIEASNFSSTNARVRLSIFRTQGGFYKPNDRSLEYLIEVESIDNSQLVFNEVGLNIDLFYDHLKPKQDLSNVKGLNSIISVLASIYMDENNLDDAILLNSDSEICETSASNIFVVKGGLIYTPPINSGCVDGIIRKKIIENADDWGYTVEEKEMKSFELIKADEVFLSNSIKGIQWVQSYKMKKYQKNMSPDIYIKLMNLQSN